MIGFHVFVTISALLLSVFAVGLYRRLRSAMPGDSLVPGLAAFGLLGTAVVQVIGTGLDTEFAFAASEPDSVVPEALVFYNHWIGTIPWLWGGAGLAGLALARAARQGAYDAWLGWASLVLGGLTALFLVSPLQYMAGMTGPVWLVVVAIGLLRTPRGA